jgi:dTDP-4-dehydrorhamnose reductase
MRSLMLRRRGIPHRVFGRKQCDVTDIHAVESAIWDGRWVVNCSSYTAVDQAETEQEAAHRVNAIGPTNIAAVCAAAGIALVHISTDYVFDGESPHPAREDDPPRPLNVYGWSKLGGETAVREALTRHVILRTSWVFSAHGQNFVRAILRLARTQSELRVVNDQIGGPTAAHDIAGAILTIICAASHDAFVGWGTYHYAGSPAVSWYEFACAIVAGSSVAVSPIATSIIPGRRADP